MPADEGDERVMATCKECLHWKVCTEYRSAFWGHKAQYSSPIINASADSCIFYKDRSRFVELPCKVGDTVYSVHGHPDYGYKIEALQAQDVALICSSGELSYSKRLNYFGKTVFLTREEAEQALKEREDNV